MATQWLLSFFSSLFTVLVNITNCIGGWVLVSFHKFLGKSAFFSMPLVWFVFFGGFLFIFFCFDLQTQNGKCSGLLGRIRSDFQEFPVWLPPQSTTQSGKLFLPHAAASQLCRGSGGCSFQGHHMLLWQLNARVKKNVWIFLQTRSLCLSLPASFHYSWLTQSSSIMLTTVQKRCFRAPFFLTFAFLCLQNDYPQRALLLKYQLFHMM